MAPLLSAPLMAMADARWLEPGWVKVRKLRLGQGKPVRRFVHVTDVHHKGDRAYLQGVVAKINALSPDFVCFTGDLIEEGTYLPEALALLSGIKSPLYGVPGNHVNPDIGWYHVPIRFNCRPEITVFDMA